MPTMTCDHLGGYTKDDLRSELGADFDAFMDWGKAVTLVACDGCGQTLTSPYDVDLWRRIKRRGFAYVEEID